MRRTTYKWDTEILYTRGDDYFAGLLEAIAQAKSTIELESYIFEKGVLADRMTERLIAARARGVKVKLLIDGWGSPGFATDYWPQLKAAGILVRFFRVIPWILKRLPGDPRSFLYRLYLRLRGMNRGNHRKFCLIDQNELWVGSYNVSDVHLVEVSGESAWKDAGVKVQGAEIKYARRAFKRAWRGWTALNWPTRSPRLLLLNDSFLHKRRTRIEQLSRLRRARRRIWLATPYFVPTGHLHRLLTSRAARGLDVRLMVPEKIDVWLIRWISLPLLERLSSKGVKIYIYPERFSHQKLFIADGWMCLGSTNLNHRSLLHDLEMDVVVTHEANQKTIVQNYSEDQKLSRMFAKSEWTSLPIWRRFLYSLFLLIRYWA